MIGSFVDFNSPLPSQYDSFKLESDRMLNYSFGSKFGYSVYDTYGSQIGKIYNSGLSYDFRDNWGSKVGSINSVIDNSFFNKSYQTYKPEPINYFKKNNDYDFGYPVKDNLDSPIGKIYKSNYGLNFLDNF